MNDSKAAFEYGLFEVEIVTWLNYRKYYQYSFNPDIMKIDQSEFFDYFYALVLDIGFCGQNLDHKFNSFTPCEHHSCQCKNICCFDLGG